MIAVAVVVAYFEEKRTGEKDRKKWEGSLFSPYLNSDEFPLDTCPEVGEFLKLTEL